MFLTQSGNAKSMHSMIFSTLSVEKTDGHSKFFLRYKFWRNIVYFPFKFLNGFIPVFN